MNFMEVTAAVRAAFPPVGRVDLERVFPQQAPVMKSVPQFMKKKIISLSDAQAGVSLNEVRQLRSLKLFLRSC